MTNIVTQGIEDDPTIIDGEMLYRKVLLRPAFITTDAVTGRTLPHIACLRYEKDGLSLLMHSELEARMEPRELCDSERTAFGFTAEVIRSADGRVKRDPQEDEPQGFAHALAGTEAPPPDKIRWSGIRKQIINKATWLVEPPGAENNVST